jgi:hypothetical protein
VLQKPTAWAITSRIFANIHIILQSHPVPEHHRGWQLLYEPSSTPCSSRSAMLSTRATWPMPPSRFCAQPLISHHSLASMNDRRVSTPNLRCVTAYISKKYCDDSFQPSLTRSASVVAQQGRTSTRKPVRGGKSEGILAQTLMRETKYIKHEQWYLSSLLLRLRESRPACNDTTYFVLA